MGDTQKILLYLYLKFRWLGNRYIYCSWNVCKKINISGFGKQIFGWQGDGAGLMFNGDQNPNETGHWFAFRESHLAEFGWVTEEGRLLQFKAEIYVWPDNPNSLDSSSSMIYTKALRFYYEPIAQKAPVQVTTLNYTLHIFCPHKYPFSTVNNQQYAFWQHYFYALDNPFMCFVVIVIGWHQAI